MDVMLALPVNQAVIETLRNLGVSPESIVEALNNRLFQLAFENMPDTPEFRRTHELLEELYGLVHEQLESHSVVMEHRPPTGLH